MAAEGLSVALARERGRFGCLVDVSVELSFSWLRRELLRHVYKFDDVGFRFIVWEAPCSRTMGDNPLLLVECVEV